MPSYSSIGSNLLARLATCLLPEL